MPLGKTFSQTKTHSEVLGEMPAAGLDAVAVAMITGAKSKISFPHDVFLDDWREEGLDKPSIARLDKMLDSVG